LVPNPKICSDALLKETLDSSCEVNWQVAFVSGTYSSYADYMS